MNSNHNIVKFTWNCFIYEHKKHSQIFYIDIFYWALEDYVNRMKEYFKQNFPFTIFNEDFTIELATNEDYEGKDILNNPTFLKALNYPLCGYMHPYIDENGKRREHQIEDKLS